MHRLALTFAIALIAATPSAAPAQPDSGGWRVLKTVKAGGEGGFDYVNVDSGARRLYVARRGVGARVTVFDLDTFKQVGEIPDTNAHGAVVDPESGHGIASSTPVLMFDARTLKPIRRLNSGGEPDGMFYDTYKHRVYVLSREEPQVTVIDPKDGTILGSFDVGGNPEEMASDGRGHLYIDVVNKANIAAIDADTMKVTAHYDMTGHGGVCAGLAMDARNRVLFATCRNPQTMVILNADTGKILDTIPIGRGTDGAAFDPAAMEAFSSNVDGTLTVVKENSPTSFTLAQTVQTMPSAKTMALDSKTGHLILIGAEYPPAPPPPALGPQNNRNPMIPGSFTIVVVGR